MLAAPGASTVKGSDAFSVPARLQRCLSCRLSNWRSSVGGPSEAVCGVAASFDITTGNFLGKEEFSMKRTLTALFLSLATAAAAHPVITSLSADALERSGRLRIRGASFGVAPDSSRVGIGGMPAAFTRWSDSLIVAYVPEAAALGAASVQVFTAGGASNEMSVGVTPRVPPQDGVAWRFEVDSMYIRTRPAVGADGTDRHWRLPLCDDARRRLEVGFLMTWVEWVTRE
jgi:hypothetical protein